VLGACPCDPTGQNFAAIRNELANGADILVVYLYLACADLADLFLEKRFPAPAPAELVVAITVFVTEFPVSAVSTVCYFTAIVTL